MGEWSEGGRSLVYLMVSCNREGGDLDRVGGAFPRGRGIRLGPVAPLGELVGGVGVWFREGLGGPVWSLYLRGHGLAWSGGGSGKGVGLGTSWLGILLSSSTFT